VLLGLEAEPVLHRTVHRARHALRPETTDRLAVLDQLVGRHLAALEEPPPRRPRLAPVILEQFGPQPDGVSDADRKGVPRRCRGGRRYVMRMASSKTL